MYPFWFDLHGPALLQALAGLATVITWLTAFVLGRA